MLADGHMSSPHLWPDFIKNVFNFIFVMYFNEIIDYCQSFLELLFFLGPESI